METELPSPAPEQPVKPSDNEQLFAILTHLSPLAGFFVPALGALLGPLIWWVLMKNKSDAVKKHGPEVMNFAISFAAYTCVAGMLVIFIIGIPLLLMLYLALIVVSIIGAVKAAEGKVFRYPLIFRLIKEESE